MLTVTLPPELENAVVAKAEQAGTTPELYVLDALRSRFLPTETVEPVSAEGQTLADFLGDFVGCLDSGDFVPGGARMSENIGEKFAQGMIQKWKQGRL